MAPRNLRSVPNISSSDDVPFVPSSSAAGTSAPRESARITIEDTIVDAKAVHYTVGGNGPTVLFLHGWGLGHHAYRAGLRRVANMGYRVVAPALPGFGGTPDLEPGNRTFVGYARWLTRFANSLDLQPTMMVGHSFGGGVAIRTLADNPKFAQGLVLLNAVGGVWRSDTSGQRPMSDRPIWDWGRAIPSDVVGLLSSAGSVFPSMLEDLVPNVFRNPFGVAKVGRLARSADLRTELAAVARNGTPITMVHSEGDGVIPAASFASLCDEARVHGRVVPGIHSWPLTSPSLFAEIVAGAAAELRRPRIATA
jgi:pimeloyl-ACP methyl ester carboxylesterase